jgi:hypothetical protein
MAKVFEHDAEPIAAKEPKERKKFTTRPQRSQRQKVFTEGNEGNEGLGFSPSLEDLPTDLRLLR